MQGRSLRILQPCSSHTPAAGWSMHGGCLRIQLSRYQWIFFLSFFLFFFISWRLITYNIVVVFFIPRHESAMDTHVFPIPIPPPTSLSTRSLWVFPVHQVWALVSCIQPGLVKISMDFHCQPWPLSLIGIIAMLFITGPTRLPGWGGFTEQERARPTDSWKERTLSLLKWNEECCFYVNQSEIVRDMAQQLREQIIKRRAKLANSWGS